MNGLQFYKYQSTGNDFILIDNRNGTLHPNRAQIAKWCHRKFGIGADGLILLNAHPEYDFEMKNYNSDGGECSMCGNGGRALVQFAADLGIKKESYRFIAIDGEHVAHFKSKTIELKMAKVQALRLTPVGLAMDTGSPHLVVPVSNLINFDVVNEGRLLRNSSLFMPGGINVNFTESKGHTLFVRTYERGVEDETLSCGTGAIAAAIAQSHNEPFQAPTKAEVPVHCQGGELKVRFTRLSSDSFDEVYLIGESERVFEGKL